MTTVVIAYRDLGCPHRRASFDFVHSYYQALGLTVVVECGDESFTRASGLNTAIRNVGHGVIVQSDPDSLVPPKQLAAAVALAAKPGLVVPHDRYLYLNAETTTRVLHGATPGDLGPEHCDDTGTGVGNVTVFSFDTWEQAGGFDERFGLWGGDDAAFAYATEAFCAPLRRIEGDMIHLWHPRLPQSIPDTPGFVEQFAILAEYRDAAADSPEAVRNLVGSR